MIKTILNSLTAILLFLMLPSAAVLFASVLVCCMHENRKNRLYESKPAINDSYMHDSVFELVGGIDRPVITQGDPGTEGNAFGFEGGRALKINKEYHIFTTEMWGEPVWCKTRIFIRSWAFGKPSRIRFLMDILPA